MPTGKGFTPDEKQQIDEAIRAAEAAARLEFSVYVGAPDGPARAYAERLLDSLTAPERSVVILVDPAGRQLVVVTGTDARADLDDAAVEEVVRAMRESLRVDDVVGGITIGLQGLARRVSAAHS